MVGYKVAIGLDKIKGPFLALVELETYDDSTVVSPIRNIIITFDGHSRSDVALRVLGSLPPEKKLDGNRMEIKKYRTNRAIVKSVMPFDKSDVRDWNGKAYSIFDLSRWIHGECAMSLDAMPCFPLSYIDEKCIVSALDRKRVNPCGEGIHFFMEKEDAILYTVFDVEEYVLNVFRRILAGWLVCNSHLIRLSE